MSEREREKIQDALDALALALSKHSHEWTNRERDLYNRAVRLLA